MIATLSTGIFLISMASLGSSLLDQSINKQKIKDREIQNYQRQFNKVKFWRDQHDQSVLVLEEILKQIKKGGSNTFPRKKINNKKPKGV